VTLRKGDVRVATARDQLTNPLPLAEGAHAEEVAKLANEMHTLERDYLLVEETHGKQVMHLTLARGYLKKLLDKGRVVRWLAQRPTQLHSRATVLRAFCERSVAAQGVYE
jgi:hypothetical protein